MDNNNRLIWLGGKMMPVTEAKINVLSPTAQFGANVFEGIRCYWSEQEQRLFAFRLAAHYKRLQQSIKLMRLKSPYTTEDFEQGLKDIVRANGYREDIAVRQTVFVDGLGGTWNSCEPINMFIAPIAKAYQPIAEKKGLRCQVSSWERISDKNLSPRAKVGANYINSRMAYLEAQQNGYDTALIPNYQGKISEGPGACFFMVRDNTLFTPPPQPPCWRASPATPSSRWRRKCWASRPWSATSTRQNCISATKPSSAVRRWRSPISPRWMAIPSDQEKQEPSPGSCRTPTIK